MAEYPSKTATISEAVANDNILGAGVSADQLAFIAGIEMPVAEDGGRTIQLEMVARVRNRRYLRLTECEIPRM